MAYEIPGFRLGVHVTAADLSAEQYKCVKVNNAAQIVLCSVLGEFSIGILQDKPLAGQAANVMVNGVSKARVAGAITAGQIVTTTANGRLQVAATGQRGIGVALETSTTADQIIAVLLVPLGVIP